MIKKLLFLMIAFSFLACQSKPTQVYETVPVVPKPILAGQDILITDKTVIVDARPAFDYTISHINGSIPLRPEDFTQRDFPMFGELESDKFALTRYLARKGISPETPTLVVGRGKKGQGEEGRVAWTLQYLGVKDVKFYPIDRFSLPLTNAEAPPRESEIIWTPEIQEALSVDRTEAKRIIKAVRSREIGWVIIDVRTEDEYLGKAGINNKKNSPDIGAINIPWTEFFDDSGKVLPSVKEKMKAIEINEDKSILVLSNQGQRSAMVLLALRSLGYDKATHFPGGYLELIETGLR